MALADAVSFTAASSGTGAFVFNAPRASFRTPLQAVTDMALINGATYSYLAQDSLTAPTQREWGRGVFNAVTNTFTRNPLGGVNNFLDTGGALVNFSVAPVVSLTLLAEDTRQILTGNASFYVNKLGSDSNPGTLAAPWATLQHAMNFISTAIDIAGFEITVNIGSGAFVGFASKATVGGGIIFFKGAGTSLTTINDGPNDGFYNFGECFDVPFEIGATHIFFDGVTFQNKGVSTPECAVIYQPAFVLFGINPAGGSPLGITFDCTFMTSGMLIDIQSGPGGAWGIFGGGGGVSIIGGGGTITNAFIAQGTIGTVVSLSGGIVTGALTVTDCFAKADGESQLNTSAAFSGVGVTGKRYNVNTGGAIYGVSPGALGPNAFPGTIAGTVDDPTSSYDGYFGPLPGINTQTASYTLVLSDAFKRIEMNVAGANTVTVPLNATVAFDIGTQIRVTRVGAGATTIAGAVGVTVDNAGALAAQWASVILYKRGTDEWVQTGV